MLTIDMKQSQVKQLADVIFRDIENYIKTHQEEYNKFLEEESEKRQGGEK